MSRTFVAVIVEGLGEFVAHAEGPLGSRPDRELVAIPFGDRGPWFERGVRDVSNVVRRFDLSVGDFQRVGDFDSKAARRRECAP